MTKGVGLHSLTSLLCFFSCVHCNEVLLLFTNIKHGSVFLCLQILQCIVCKTFSIMHILCFQHANYTRWFSVYTQEVYKLLFVHGIFHFLFFISMSIDIVVGHEFVHQPFVIV